MTAPTTESVTTDQLREGDIVLHHGMVLDLSNPKSWPHAGYEGRTVYSWLGTVLNPAEGADKFEDIPRSWWVDGWHVQGNELAHWVRYTPAAAAAYRATLATV